MKKLISLLLLTTSFTLIADIGDDGQSAGLQPSDVMSVVETSSYIVTVNDGGYTLPDKPSPVCVDSIEGYTTEVAFSSIYCDVNYTIQDANGEIHRQVHNLNLNYKIPAKKKVKFTGFDITWVFTGGAIGSKPTKTYSVYNKDAKRFAQIDGTNRCYMQAKKLLSTLCDKRTKRVLENQLFDTESEKQMRQSALSLIEINK
jgi:hypothetical protein